jgi:hypothetical protein
MKIKTFLARLASARSFPLELTLSGGERHVAIHPDYAYLGPGGGLCLFSERWSCDVEIPIRDVVRIRPLRRPSGHGRCGSSW